MKIKEITKLKGDELDKKLAELKTELMKLKGQAATGTPPKSPGQIGKIKKTIARILTVKQQQHIQTIKTKQPKEEKTSNA